MNNWTDLRTDFATDLDRPAIRLLYHHAEVDVALRPTRIAHRGTEEDYSRTGIVIANPALCLAEFFMLSNRYVRHLCQNTTERKPHIVGLPETVSGLYLPSRTDQSPGAFAAPRSSLLIATISSKRNCTPVFVITRSANSPARTDALSAPCPSARSARNPARTCRSRCPPPPHRSPA